MKFVKWGVEHSEKLREGEDCQEQPSSLLTRFTKESSKGISNRLFIRGYQVDRLIVTNSDLKNFHQL